MAASTNPWELAARLRKAEALVNVLDGAGMTPAGVSVFEPSDWKLAADAAAVRVPSSTTCTLIIEMLRARKAARQSFAGTSAAA